MTVRLQALVWDCDALTNSLIPLSHNLAIFKKKKKQLWLHGWQKKCLSEYKKKKRKNIQARTLNSGQFAKLLSDGLPANGNNTAQKNSTQFRAVRGFPIDCGATWIVRIHLFDKTHKNTETKEENVVMNLRVPQSKEEKGKRAAKERQLKQTQHDGRQEAEDQQRLACLSVQQSKSTEHTEGIAQREALESEPHISLCQVIPGISYIDGHQMPLAETASVSSPTVFVGTL